MTGKGLWKGEEIQRFLPAVKCMGRVNKHANSLISKQVSFQLWIPGSELPPGLNQRDDLKQSHRVHFL